ncbi:MAG: endonuclease/exonuclease/phosphatase family protein [Flavobacteriales bacterium]|nr:endonuclease/exonuclease/phosphatase family protein [Flavobacteriales bacterium]
MKNLSIIGKLIFVLNSVFGILLLITYLAPFVPPDIFWPIAFFGLAYPFILLINIVFGIYWLVTFKRQILLSVIVIGCGWGQLTNFIQLGSSENQLEGFKVMSYNVRLFDLYNWSDNKQTRNKIFELIDEKSADIICFQEFFYSEKRGYFNTLDTLREFQKAKYYHTACTTTNSLHYFGIATLSKYPIINREKVSLQDSKNNICIYTDVLIDQDTIRIYNMHLASVHLGKENYDFIENINNQETDEQLDGSKKIVELLKNAFIKRSEQARTIAEHIDNSPYKVVVCGDFNDTPSSFTYRTISNDLCDSFSGSGVGVGATYNSSVPVFRIDYILHDKKLTSSNFGVTPENISDHFPITTVISFME